MNLDTHEEPKNVNLGACCTLGEMWRFIHLFKQYKYVFACTYDELKTHDTQIIQHGIPMKLGVKPFQPNPKKVHPTLEPLITKELDPIIISKVRRFERVVNLVPIQNKLRDNIMCIFHNFE